MRKMVQVKEQGGGMGRKVFFPSPLFHFLALVPFLARSKPKIPFLGLSLLRNQMGMLATQCYSNTVQSNIKDVRIKEVLNKIKALDCKTNSPHHSHRKCM